MISCSFLFDKLIFCAGFSLHIFQVRRREFHRAYDRIYATLYGHCVGDAIGLLTEGLTKEEVKKVGLRSENRLFPMAENT